MSVTPAALLQGLILGVPYGLLAVGLVLVYKVSRFINFAQGAIGAFGGAIVGSLVVTYGVPYWPAFALGVLSAAGIAAATEATVVRRLQGQPRMMGVIITLLLAQLLVGIAMSINTDAAFGTTYPDPSGFPSFEVGSLVIVPSYTALLVLGPLVVLGVVLLLRRTRFGLGIRATAANPDAAWLAGLAPLRIAQRSWALAGGIAAFSAILLWPTQGNDALSPSLMLRGLVAAAIARFVSVGVAFAAGLVIGVVDVVIRTQSATSGLLDVILLATALVVLLVRPLTAGRESSGDGDWTKLTLRRAPSAYRRFWLTRHFGVVMGVATLVLMATAVPVWFLDNSSAFVLVQVFAFGIVGLSVLVLTGKGGQLSLGQFAVAAVGAVVSVRVVAETDVFVLGPIAAVVSGAVVSAILGLPTLRTRGPVLAITTLAFALATRSWILPQEWAIGDGLAADQPVVGTIALDSSSEYYFYALLVLGLAAWATRWYVVSRAGRELVALRDNEGAARALGVPVVLRKVQVLLVAGALAGLGGSLLAHSRNLISITDFPATASIEVVVLAVVGGISVVSGPLLGAVLAVGLPALAGLDVLATAGLQALFLLLVLFRPAGVMSVLTPIRDWWLEEWARVRGVDPATLAEQPVPHDSPFSRPLDLRLLAVHHPAGSGAPLLDLDGVSRRFGGVRAVQSVTLRVETGECVAVIGPNGAGKTTLFEIASGFVRPDEGTVRLGGDDVTRIPPERRAARGLVRSFQNALLFPTLDVRDTIALALARRPRAAGHLGTEDVLEASGLLPYADLPVGTLSTGVRRMVELACDLALAPRVALLDEPSAGISHHEIPALAALIQSMRSALGITLVVIDHDMTLLRTCCDRFVALELGVVTATGSAEEVLTDARVVASFLGDNAAAVDRSGLAGRLAATID